MTLESERLTYEKITKKHADELKNVLCDPRVYMNVDDGVAPSFDELIESFALREKEAPHHRSDEQWVDYIVRTKELKIAIGRIEATVLEDRAEVAYMLGSTYWRKGYGSEILQWLQSFLNSNYKVKAFWATVTPGNEASKHLLLKNGYVEVFLDLPRLTSYDENDWFFFKEVGTKRDYV